MYFLHALKNKELFLDLTKKYGNSYVLNQKKISKENINFLSKLKKKTSFKI